MIFVLLPRKQACIVNKSQM